MRASINAWAPGFFRGANHTATPASSDRRTCRMPPNVGKAPGTDKGEAQTFDGLTDCDWHAHSEEERMMRKVRKMLVIELLQYIQIVWARARWGPRRLK